MDYRTPRRHCFKERISPSPLVHCELVKRGVDSISVTSKFAMWEIKNTVFQDNNTVLYRTGTLNGIDAELSGMWCRISVDGIIRNLHPSPLLHDIMPNARNLCNKGQLNLPNVADFGIPWTRSRRWPALSKIIAKLYRDICKAYFPRWKPWGFTYNCNWGMCGYCNCDQKHLYFGSPSPVLIIHEICHAVGFPNHGERWQTRVLEAAETAKQYDCEFSKKLIT